MSFTHHEEVGDYGHTFLILSDEGFNMISTFTLDTRLNKNGNIFLLPNENATIFIDDIQQCYSINGHQKHFIYFFQHVCNTARDTYVKPVCSKWSNCCEIDIQQLKEDCHKAENDRIDQNIAKKRFEKHCKD